MQAERKNYGHSRQTIDWLVCKGYTLLTFWPHGDRLGIIKGISRETRYFFFGLLKQWLGYIWKATGVVTALAFSPYVQNFADIRQYAIYFIYAYATSIVVLRIFYRDSRWGLWYARQFFGFVQWFLAVVASIMAPFVPTFLPFLTLPGVVPKLAISLLILLLLLFIGVFVGLGEIFKRVEDEWVMAFQKNYATPDYEAILMGEEFEHQQTPPPTRKERLRKWWEWEKERFRRWVKTIRDP